MVALAVCFLAGAFIGVPCGLLVGQTRRLRLRRENADLRRKLNGWQA